MKKLNILFLALLFSFSVSGQIQWQKSLGGTYADEAYSIIQTYDSGYVVAGFTDSNDSDVTGNHGYWDYWVVKLNASGTIEWQKSLGGTDYDIAYSIIQTSDSGYAVAGFSESNDGDVTGNHGNRDYWVVKLNATGTIEWQKSLGGTGDDEAHSIIQTSDNGYIVAGYSVSNDSDVTGNHGLKDYWVVKLNVSGTIEWQKSLGGTSDDEAWSVIQAYDSGYVVAGQTESIDGDITGNHGYIDYWIVKLNASGAIQWQKTFGGTNQEYAYCIIQTHDSGYAVTGTSVSNDGDVTVNHGGGDYWVVKLNASGAIEWQKSFGGTTGDIANSICQTYDSGYVVAGYTYSNDVDVTGNHGSFDYWMVRLNASGTMEWQKCLGGTGNDNASSIIQTSDNGYVVAGYSYSNDGDVTGNHGYFDYWIVKLAQTTGIENLSTSNTLNIYPNPSTHNFSIPSNREFDNAQLNIFNALGCNVYSCRLNRETKVIDAENFSSGIYYLQIIKGEKMWGEKIIKQ
ncbi:MAG: T9SS type A sorting domain-containing protein [Bacteroidia bacterium]